MCIEITYLLVQKKVCLVYSSVYYLVLDSMFTHFPQECGGMVEHFVLTASFDGSVVTTVCIWIKKPQPALWCNCKVICLPYSLQNIYRFWLKRIYVYPPARSRVILQCRVLYFVTALDKVKERLLQHALPFGGPQVALQRTVLHTGYQMYVTFRCRNLKCVRNFGLEVGEQWNVVERVYTSYLWIEQRAVQPVVWLLTLQRTCKQLCSSANWYNVCEFLVWHNIYYIKCN